MAHKTTPEENYSGLTEDGFEPWTVGWDEFFDFIGEHNGEKIDVTIDSADIEKVKEYFKEDDQADAFFDQIESLGIAEKTLVLRLPNGLEHLGMPYYLSIECIARLYIPPTFWETLDVPTDFLVVPSNYTYVTREVETEDDVHGNSKSIYNTEETEKEYLYKTYKTDVTHFPAGKYTITLSSNVVDLDVYDGDDVYEIACKMADYNGSDASFDGCVLQGAKMTIKNLSTDQTWTFSVYDEMDTPPMFCFDEFTPSVRYDTQYHEQKNIRFHLWDGGEFWIDEEDFPEGFNFGDIVLTMHRLEDYIDYVTLKSVKGIKPELEPGETGKEGWYKILGEEYDEDEIAEIAEE